MGNATYHTRGKLIDGYRVRKHPCYFKWSNMKQRCNNPNLKSYKDYGGRGIKYCSRWEHFENFVLDMGLPPYEEATIDRKNNNKNYTPSNCKWSNRTEQCINRRTFSNNTSGARGVIIRGARFAARYDEYKIRYNLGNFSTLVEAVKYRKRFIKLLGIDKFAALKMTKGKYEQD